MSTSRSLDPTAAAGFDVAAADYERARPGYPHAVASLLASELGLGPGSWVCDLGAGTGKFTRLLLRLGCDVVAVEPVAGMRHQLLDVLPEVEVVDGTAEAIPLADTCLDAVTVAAAFHWFDHAVALDEIRRVLRPDGGLALVWNRRDDAIPWVAAMSDILSWPNRPRNYDDQDWPKLVASHGGFGSVERYEHEWEQPMTRDRLAARVRSISFVAAADEREREACVRQVLGLVDRFDEPFALPQVTHVYWCHRQT